MGFFIRCLPGLCLFWEFDVLVVDQQGEEFANSHNDIFLTFERAYEVNCNHVGIWLMPLILISIFHVFFFLRRIYGELKCAKYMSLIIVNRNVKKMDSFCPSVDVVWGSMS